MAKIAVELEQALARRAREGAPGAATGRMLAQGPGWTVEDVLCTSGPRDRVFEETHDHFAIAIVVAGTFQYRAAHGRELMTPGSVMLGNAGQSFECSHEHGCGDRCLSFHYSAEYFEEITASGGGRRPRAQFGLLRVPPVKELSGVIARACAGMGHASPAAWEELGVQLAGRALRLAQGGGMREGAPSSTISRVTRAVRRIEQSADATLTLRELAREAGLSPFHFLRTFGQVTGLTPHQFVRRMRLRAAGARLASDSAKVLDVALDCGFGDVSNFNHAFRAEFGMSPRRFRALL